MKKFHLFHGNALRINYLRKKIKQYLYSVPLYNSKLKREWQSCRWTLTKIKTVKMVNNGLWYLIFVQIFFQFVLVIVWQLIISKKNTSSSVF